MPTSIFISVVKEMLSVYRIKISCHALEPMLQSTLKQNRSSKVRVQGLLIVAHSLYIHTVYSSNHHSLLSPCQNHFSRSNWLTHITKQALLMPKFTAGHNPDRFMFISNSHILFHKDPHYSSLFCKLSISKMFTDQNSACISHSSYMVSL
jgi:hypothetical protein